MCRFNRSGNPASTSAVMVRQSDEQPDFQSLVVSLLLARLVQERNIVAFCSADVATKGEFF